MTEHDDLMDFMDDDLRDLVLRVRPGDLASASTPAAEALVEGILSMQHTQIADIADNPLAVDADTPPVARPSRRRPVVLAAAAAFALVCTTGVLVVGSGEPSSAEVVATALAKSSSLLDRSGRADVSYRAEWDIGWIETHASSWRFSGADSEVTLVDTCMEDDPSDCAINRHVDGEVYLYVGTHELPEFRWYRNVDADENWREGFALDPATLLDELDPAGGYDEVGHEVIGGVETTRLRASDPERTPVPDVDGVGGDTVSSLEVWVDHDGVVRRLDITTVEKHPAPEEPTAGCPDCLDLRLVEDAMSIKFYDLGTPITIEAPSEFEDLHAPA